MTLPSEEGCEATLDGGLVVYLALPHDHDAPPQLPELSDVSSVPNLVPLELVLPVAAPGSRSRAPRASVTMPEAPVDEDDLPGVAEDEIWRAWKIRDIRLESRS